MVLGVKRTVYYSTLASRHSVTNNIIDIYNHPVIFDVALPPRPHTTVGICSERVSA